MTFPDNFLDSRDLLGKSREITEWGKNTQKSIERGKEIIRQLLEKFPKINTFAQLTGLTTTVDGKNYKILSMDPTNDHMVVKTTEGEEEVKKITEFLFQPSTSINYEEVDTTPYTA